MVSVITPKMIIETKRDSIAYASLLAAVQGESPDLQLDVFAERVRVNCEGIDPQKWFVREYIVDLLKDQDLYEWAGFKPHQKEQAMAQFEEWKKEHYLN